MTAIMKKLFLTALLLSPLTLCTCSNDGESSSFPGMGGMVPVTINLGSVGMDNGAPSLFDRIRRLLVPDALAQSIPVSVTAITVTVTGPDFSTISQSFSPSGAITVVVPSGLARRFLVQGVNADGVALYSGTTIADISFVSSAMVIVQMRNATFAINSLPANGLAAEANAVALDNDALYIAGYDHAGASLYQWRIEKRNRATGELVTGFGTGGVVNTVVAGNSSLTEARAIAVDDTAIYVGGYRTTGTLASFKMGRIEKWDKMTGTLINNVPFGTTNGASVQAIRVDSAYLYVAGIDGTGSGDWYVQKIDKNTLAAVATFGTAGAYVYNPGTFTDGCYSLDFDGTGLYLAGSTQAVSGDSQLAVQKLNADGAPQWTVVTNPGSAYPDNFYSLVIDAAYVYAGGSDMALGLGNDRWRIEKYNVGSGLRVNAFGSSGIKSNFTSTVGKIYGLAVDANHLYAAGMDTVLGIDTQWRIEKYNKTSGNPITEFGTGGTLSNNPTAAQADEPRSILVDTGYVYIVGYDSATAGNVKQWRIEKRLNRTGSY